MRRSSFRLVAAAAAIALAVTGCSSSSDEAANEDTEFEIFTWWASGGEAAGLQGMIDVYTAQTQTQSLLTLLLLVVLVLTQRLYYKAV